MFIPNFPLIPFKGEPQNLIENNIDSYSESDEEIEEILEGHENNQDEEQILITPPQSPINQTIYHTDIKYIRKKAIRSKKRTSSILKPLFSIDNESKKQRSNFMLKQSINFRHFNNENKIIFVNFDYLGNWLWGLIIYEVYKYHKKEANIHLFFEYIKYAIRKNTNLLLSYITELKLNGQVDHIIWTTNYCVTQNMVNEESEFIKFMTDLLLVYCELENHFESEILGYEFFSSFKKTSNNNLMFFKDLSFCTHPNSTIVILEDPSFSGRLKVEDIDDTMLVKCLNIGRYDVKIPLNIILDIDKNLVPDEFSKNTILLEIEEHYSWYPDRIPEKEYRKENIIENNLSNAITILSEIFCDQ